jgi:hypothetical protein
LHLYPNHQQRNLTPQSPFNLRQYLTSQIPPRTLHAQTHLFKQPIALENSPPLITMSISSLSLDRDQVSKMFGRSFIE